MAFVMLHPHGKWSIFKVEKPVPRSLASWKKWPLSKVALPLQEIRKLPELREKSPGVFYFKSIPFLHFHDKDGIRWADVKKAGDWTRLEIGFAAGAKARRAFLKAVSEAHEGLHSK
jgi:hypothetical protein